MLGLFNPVDCMSQSKISRNNKTPSFQYKSYTPRPIPMCQRSQRGIKQKIQQNKFLKIQFV